MKVNDLKTIEQYFCDWEGHVFGFGYGSGEPHVLPTLKNFLEIVPDDGPYDYKVLERGAGPAVAWLMLNTLHHHDIFEYGTSPRYAWLTKSGKALKRFIGEHTADQLVELCCSRTEGDFPCYPDACNCGPEGHEKGAVCANPFWSKDA